MINVTAFVLTLCRMIPSLTSKPVLFQYFLYSSVSVLASRFTSFRNYIVYKVISLAVIFVKMKRESQRLAIQFIVVHFIFKNLWTCFQAVRSLRP